MKFISHILLLVFFAVLFSACNRGKTSGQSNKDNGPHLFVIWENNKAGFVNEDGKVIIPPRFNAASDFSQGLANIREGGFYGYINTSGEYEIPPAFEYATPFSNGMAVVYKGEKAFYIQRDGKVAFKRSFTDPGPFNENGLALIGSAKGLQGVINLSGHVILDTIYTSICFNNNKFIVYANGEPGLADSLGRFIVPLGRYETISALGNNYYVAETTDQQDLVINGDGQVISAVKNDYHIQPDRSDNYVVLMKYANNQADIALSDLHSAIKYTDTSGHFTIGKFASNRFIVSNDGLLSVFSPDGRQVGPSFQDIYNRRFYNGYAFAGTGDKYGIIDTNATFVSDVRFDNIQQPDCGEGCFIYSENINGTELFGIGQLTGKKILLPVMEWYDDNGFVNGVMRGVIEGKAALINKEGKIIWQDKSKLRCTGLNIDYKHPFYMHVDSKNNPRFKEGTFENIDSSRPITNPTIPPNQLSIFIDTSKTDTFEQVYKGYNVYISNRTDTVIKFSTQDTHLYCNMQALDAKNEWRDIEYIEFRGCNYSIGMISLPVNEWWQLKCPMYEGSIKTKLRLALKIRPTMPAVYSNVIDGSINPAQFWRIKPRSANNIMDPMAK